MFLNPLVRYNKYKYRAKKKNIDFEIPKLMFAHFITSPCYYCGGHEYLDKNGIDRIDNTKGYISGNCVTSCWICNRAKGTLTLDEFVNYLKQFNDLYEVRGKPLVWTERSVSILERMMKFNKTLPY